MGSSPDRVKPKIINCVFVAYNGKHAVLRIKSKDWLARNQDNVSEWSDMYIRGLLFPLANTMKKTKRVGLEKKRTSSSSHCKLTWSRHAIAIKLLSWR